MQECIGAAEEKIDVNANRIRVVIERYLGRLQVEVVLVIEVVALIGLGDRAVVVVAEVAIHIAAEIHRPHAPNRSSGRSGCGWGRGRRIWSSG
jgi:hypothetical protein